MRGVRIDYGGTAVGAKENFVPYTDDKAGFVDLNDIKKDNMEFPNYGNPCELYSVVLDGSAQPFSEGDENLGWWSEQTSLESGEFTNPIVLTLTAAGYYYRSSGITLTFDTYNNIYANNVNIKWYSDETLLDDVDFEPDSSFYSCQNKVEDYNKVVITFYAMNMPFNRLKLRSVDYGMRITFFGNELKNTKIIQEIDPLSSRISINTCDFTLESKRNIEYSFQERQPVSIYFNNILQATAFIKSAKRKSKNTWSIQAEDYIGIMQDVLFYGGIYSAKNAVELFEEIFTVAKVPFYIQSGFENVSVTGYIPYTTCREALMQVAFAVGAVVDTSNSDRVKVYKTSNDVSQIITLDRIMQGQTFEDKTKVTTVEIVAHKYTPTSTEIVAYDASESGQGENILVKFSQPLHNLVVENGEIIDSGTNYAIINANASCKLIGNGYEHTQTVSQRKQSKLSETDTENIILVQNATLISAENVDAVLERCYNYYSENQTVQLKIVDGKHSVLYGIEKYGEVLYGGLANDAPTNVGRYITCETAYLGDISGTVLKQTYNLNGGIVVKNTSLKKG